MEPHNEHITAHELLTLGYPQSKVIGVALEVINSQPEVSIDLKKILGQILVHPDQFINDDQFGLIAMELMKPQGPALALRKTAPYYKVYGAEAIDQGALDQMETAMRLPVTMAGALMPDAHPGYGLPIGGVLATDNAVIPYGVGVDIGCRMCMTIYEMPASTLEERREDLREILTRNTRFGRDAFDKPRDHEVLEDPLFNEIKIVGFLKDRAAIQIGSSGGGNHFVEFGVTEILDQKNEFGLSKGKYLALLSHSGSRGLGANIARHYTRLAMESCKLPKAAKQLAWLGLDTEEGQEYWLAMNLAGAYASACHHQIHERMAESLGSKPLTMIENHHNFAWKEKDQHGNEIIVHRKGATPAGKGVAGIIPGSMTAPGYIVRGKGKAISLNSAAHGAGRVMSRTKAKTTLNKKTILEHLRASGVEVIGSGLDEAPMVYKDIREVMRHQRDLVDVIGIFQPKIVRMCGDQRFHEVD